MIIISPQYGVIPLNKINSDDFPAPYLPGSESFYCKEHFGTIMLQEYKNEFYSFKLAVFDLIKNITLSIKEDQFPFRAAFSLNNSFKVKANRSSKLKLEKGQYIFCSTQDKELLMQFEKTDNYQIFESSFSKELLTNFIEPFASLKEYIEGVSKNTHPRHFISAETKKIIHDILNCPYDINLRRLYFENKVNDLLFEILIRSFDPSQATTLTQRRTEAIFNTRDIILQDIRKHYSIKELATIVSLSQGNLKAGFKQVFGTSIFDFLLQTRMEKAYQLITQTNIPIKEIASGIGFEYMANFITSFRKRYGKTPGELRKK